MTELLCLAVILCTNYLRLTEKSITSSDKLTLISSSRRSSVATRMKRVWAGSHEPLQDVCRTGLTILSLRDTSLPRSLLSSYPITCEQSLSFGSHSTDWSLSWMKVMEHNVGKNEFKGVFQTRNRTKNHVIVLKNKKPKACLIWINSLFRDRFVKFQTQVYKQDNARCTFFNQLRTSSTISLIIPQVNF